jgi:hypothetical protein
METNNRIDQLINDRYPGKVEMIHRVINIMKEDYDQDQFLEEDIMENILMELDII